MTRRRFLGSATALAAASTVGIMDAAAAPATHSTAPSRPKGPKRGVSFYSYSAEWGFEKNLEDCFEDVQDMGAHGIEILCNAHVENYPYPTQDWIRHFADLCLKHDIEPVEYGHWVDARVLQDRMLSVDECLEYLERDMRLARTLGFGILRTKMTVKDGELAPVDNWEELIEKALPLAERLNVVMCPEIHTPSKLSSAFVTKYVDFIKRTQTRHFALNLDFSLFRSSPQRQGRGDQASAPTQPEDIIPLLPYVACCHAKLFNMSEDFHETEIPYERLLGILKDKQWDGWLLSEYEGSDKYDQGYEVGQTLRRQHIMMKRILGA